MTGRRRARRSGQGAPTMARASTLRSLGCGSEYEPAFLVAPSADPRPRTLPMGCNQPSPHPWTKSRLASVVAAAGNRVQAKTLIPERVEQGKVPSHRGTGRLVSIQGSRPKQVKGSGRSLLLCAREALGSRGHEIANRATAPALAGRASRSPLAWPSPSTSGRGRSGPPEKALAPRSWSVAWCRRWRRTSSPPARGRPSCAAPRLR
jgi:hypothetical protein